MAKIPPLPAYLTKKDVQKLLEACEKFYAVELLGEGYRGYLATRWAIPALGYNWKNSREFFKDISALTQQDSAKDVYAVLSGWEGEAPLALPVQETQDISETVPRNLKELEEALDKAKSEKEKLALAKNYQFLKGKVAPETPKPETEPPAGEAPPKPEPAVSREAEEVPAAAPAPSVETYTVGIQIAPQAGKVFQKFANRVASAPVRAAIAFAGPTIAAQQGGVTASALTLWARGIKSGPLEKEVSKLEAKEAKEFDGLIKAIKNIETDRSLQTRIIQRAFPVERLSLVLKAGATQAQVNIFINPPEAEGVTAVPRRSFLGNLLAGAGQQVFGKIASKAVSGLASKATGKVVGKGVGAAAGTAVGGPVGTAVGYAISWLTDKVVGKVVDFLREHRGVAYAILFLPVAGAGLLFGIPILTIAGGLGVAVSLTGGTGAAVAGLGGALQGLFGALGSVFVTSIATPVIVALISIPVVVALILFIINSGAYIVPPSPFAETPFGPGIECSEEKAAISFANSGGSPISRRAWQITADLYQGFWCFWNRSPGDFPEDVTSYPPSYPNLFNEGLFARAPNPSRAQISSCGDCMFWCTYLVIKSFLETGNRSLQITLWSPTMEADFRTRGKFVSSSNATPANVVPGSVLFFRVAGGPARTNHVGIVHSVSQDAIVYLQSNAPTKSGSLTFSRNGRGIISPPGLGVVGVGLP